MTYRTIQFTHGGVTTHKDGGVETARAMADEDARHNKDGLYRVFGPFFIVAFSVLDGVVRELRELDIPEEHR